MDEYTISSLSINYIYYFLLTENKFSIIYFALDSNELIRKSKASLKISILFWQQRVVVQVNSRNGKGYDLALYI